MTAAIVNADANEFGYPPDADAAAISQFIETAPKAHPRLLITQADLAGLRTRVAAHPLQAQIAQAVLREADAMLKIEPIEHKKTGRRLLGQSRRCVKRTLTLGMAYLLTETPVYAERCTKEMRAVAAFSDWNPSHYLDVAEMTFAMAVGYDWLHDALGEDDRKLIRQAILDKGVKLPLETRHNRWVKAGNNWGQVCHGGMVAGALAVMEDEPEIAARTIENALRNVVRSIRVYAPNGAYPEGPGYWAYGTTYNVLLIAMLESALGTEFGLVKAPGFSKTGEYVSLATGPSGEFFNYADGGSGRGPQPALHWFASRFSRPDWLLGEEAILRQQLPGLGAKSAGSQSSRFLPLTLLWLRDADVDADIRMPLHWSGGGHVPVTVHRSSWTDPNAVYIGLKAGSPSAPHGQMDTGSFVLDADGVRWALDLGAEGYHGIESRGMNLWSSAQDSDRWKIFRQSNAGHNTLVLDGNLQVAKGHAPLVRFSADPEFPHSVIDMTSVYAGQCKQAIRGVALLPTGQVLIQDRLTGVTPGCRVRWGMITKGKPSQTGAAAITLTQGQASLDMTILTPAAAWRTVDTATPRNEWDSRNGGTVMVSFDVVADSPDPMQLAVVLTPGSRRNGALRDIPLTSPLEWSGE